MVVVALVGGTGTGKSTIASHLASKGASLVDADRIAHDLLDSDSAVREALRREFGPDIFSPGDGIDRRRLGRLVFSDTRALARLNSILHPPIIRRAQEMLERFESEGRRIVVIDAALLLEVEVPFRVDMTIALRCGEEEQRGRLRRLGKYSEEEIELRLENQRHLERSFHKADVVLDTGRSIPEVLEDVDRMVDRILSEGKDPRR